MTDLLPWPLADDVTAPFWSAAAEHRLVAPRCEGCGAWQWPPTDPCPTCGATGRTWAELSGRGRLHSWIVDHRNMVPGFAGAYVVALVSPDEVEDDDPVRFVTNLPGAAEETLQVGMPVRVVWEERRPGVVLPQFVPAT